MCIKKYEILGSLPVYGPMYTSVSIDGEPYYSEGFVVRFYRKDNTEWVANFKPSWRALYQVIEIDGSNNLVVIAGGICYIMNPDSNKPLSSFCMDIQKVYVTSNNRVVLQDSTHFAVVEIDGNVWCSELISWGGFSDVNIQGNIITGLSYGINEHSEWVPFVYDLESRNIIGGSCNRTELKKQWWKFWA